MRIPHLTTATTAALLTPPFCHSLRSVCKKKWLDGDKKMKTKGLNRSHCSCLLSVIEIERCVFENCIYFYYYLLCTYLLVNVFLSLFLVGNVATEVDVFPKTHSFIFFCLLDTLSLSFLLPWDSYLKPTDRDVSISIIMLMYS